MWVGLAGIKQKWMELLLVKYGSSCEYKRWLCVRKSSIYSFRYAEDIKNAELFSFSHVHDNPFIKEYYYPTCINFFKFVP
jgi:hypothetical protein